MAHLPTTADDRQMLVRADQRGRILNMEKLDRRGLLGGAAMAAGGLVWAGAAGAQESPSRAGDGGYGRAVAQLPPGDAVAHHDAADIGAMPDFHYSLDGSKPKV